MFSSFASLSIPRFGFGKTAKDGEPINIPPVEVHDIELAPDKRARRLKHFLKLNHANFAILYHHLEFENHTPHHLGSAFLLSCTDDQLSDIYDHASKNEGHEPWTDSPGEIALHDYRDFLGQKEYQRAFVDFFEDQMVLQGYDWKSVVSKFLFESGPKHSANPLPLFNSLVGGLAHPLIHLGYAYELNSREVAMEAMGLVAACYDPHLASLFVNNSSNTAANATANPLTPASSNPFEIFAYIHGDKRLDSVFTQPGYDNLHKLLNTPDLTSILLSYFNAWKITNPVAQFESSQRLVTTLLLSCSPNYDFFLVHLLTSSHAVRILLPLLPAEHHIPLLREWWLISIAIYIAQLRPLVDPEPIKQFDLKGRGWEWVTKEAVGGKWRLDTHFVKACRSMKVLAETWENKEGEKGSAGDEDQYYLKAAVKFAQEFNGWVGWH